MSERAYTTTKAGELLGGLNPKDVRRLVRDGKLEARKFIARGKGVKPRLLILESAINTFLRRLDPAETRAELEKRIPAPSKPRARRQNPRGILTGVTQFV